LQLTTAPVRAFEAVVDFLYPPRCLLCPSAVAERGRGVCRACLGDFTLIGPQHELWRASAGKLLRDGLVDGMVSLYLFEKNGPLQRALHLLKYGGMKSLGGMFGRDLARSPAFGEICPAADAIVPVPLHGARLRERGYNQSGAISDGIGSVTGLPASDRVLVRTRNTPSQTTLKLHRREENVRDAFGVAASGVRVVEGKSVILVDDVLTTGATLRACARALKGAGASSVVCATVAIAD